MDLKSKIKFDKLLKNSSLDLATRRDAKHLDSDTKQEILTETENGADFKEVVLDAIREYVQSDESYNHHNFFLDDDLWGNDDSTSFDSDDNSTEDWIDSSNDWSDDGPGWSGWGDDPFDGFGGSSGNGGSDDTW